MRDNITLAMAVLLAYLASSYLSPHHSSSLDSVPHSISAKKLFVFCLPERHDAKGYAVEHLSEEKVVSNVLCDRINLGLQKL
jgi:hypothetical protein